jgi:hypothetical protein
MSEEEEFTDEQFIEAAVRDYGSDDIMVQTPGPFDTPVGIVDRINGGAWVMAWLYVEEASIDFRKERS